MVTRGHGGLVGGRSGVGPELTKVVAPGDSGPFW